MPGKMGYVLPDIEGGRLLPNNANDLPDGLQDYL